MGKRSWAVALAAALTAPPPVGAADRASQTAAAEKACLEADFVGCVVRESGRGHFQLLALEGCNGGNPAEELRRHRARLDERCKERCEAEWLALEEAIAERRTRVSECQGQTMQINAQIAKWPDLPVPPEGGGLANAGRLWAFDEFREDVHACNKAVEEEQARVKEKESAYKECACRCDPVGAGFGRRAKVAGGAALAGAVAAGLVAAGGGGGGASPPTSTPSAPSTPPARTPVGSARPDGTYGLSWTVERDDQLSADRVGLQAAQEARIAINGTAATMTGQTPLPTLAGTWDPESQRLTVTGAGPLAGRPQVGVALVGTLTAAGALNATVTVGEDGSLGGQLPHVVRYSVMGVKQ